MPRRAAKAASLASRSGLSATVASNWAAQTDPIPGRASKSGCGLPDDLLDVGVVVADLGVQVLLAARESGQGQARAVDAGESDARGGQVLVAPAVDAGSRFIVGTQR
jgi:hypothetical protein